MQKTLKNLLLFNLGYKTKIGIIIIGSMISIAFLFFTTKMASELEKQEFWETKLWSMAMTINANPNDINTPQNIKNLISDILSNDNEISFIVTKKNLSILTFMNVDDEIMVNPKLLRKELEDMTNNNEPIVIELNNGNFYYIFYRESQKLIMMRYLPYVQFFTLIMLLGLIAISYSSSKNNEQNKIWVGMAKETAHQLGTPSSSLLGWLEYLRGENIEQSVVDEIGKDISRLLKVVDRFSKIGSEPTLSPHNIIETVDTTIQYFQMRMPKKVSLSMINDKNIPIQANINSSLIEWVMENTIKNAIDALGGEGTIKVRIYDVAENVVIDIIDNGKGIAKNNFKKVFKPGFSTKTRGWGLGLSLCKRIIEENHDGKMYVAQSEIGKGTIMRLELKKI